MKNLDETKSYQQLLSFKQGLKTLQECGIKEREQDFVSRHDLLSFSFAATHLNLESLEVLQQLADEQGVIDAFKELLEGKQWGENAPVAIQHHHLRNHSIQSLLKDDGIIDFVTDIRNSKRYSSVVYVGIGGSYLGPEVLYQALKHICPLQIEVFFLHSVDPCNLKEVLNQIVFEETLFVFSSKSGSTYETLDNLKQLRIEAEKRQISSQQFTQQCVGVTCKETLLDSDEFCRMRFYITPEIVGRFSVTSAVGMLIVGLAFGWDIVCDILGGAYALDQSALNSDFMKNPSLAAALLTVWERNVLGYSAKAIIPYSYGLSRFPAFLQQLICESNGKRVNLHGERVSYGTSPVIFGEPGTEAQHSFFQMLHQGTDVVPVQFISIGKKYSKDLYINIKAQMMALALGNTEDNVFEFCPGNRPSTYLEIHGLSPKTLGALIAFYENAVMFEGFLWNINSFDQEGVQLGKKLAEQLNI